MTPTYARYMMFLVVSTRLKRASTSWTLAQDDQDVYLDIQIIFLGAPSWSQLLDETTITICILTAGLCGLQKLRQILRDGAKCWPRLGFESHARFRQRLRITAKRRNDCVLCY